MRAFREWFERHRKGLARLVLLLGAAYAIADLLPRFPQETEVEFTLGPQHDQVVELRVAYLHDGEELAGASFGFPKGAPATVRHRVRLPAGRLELRCELRGRSGDSRSFVRRLQTPASGLVKVELSPDRNMRSVYSSPSRQARVRGRG